MANDIALFKTAGLSLANIGMFKTSIAQVQMEAPQIGGDHLLRLTKDGIWCYGKELQEVEPGSLWAADPSSFMKGYSAFVGQKPKEVMRNIMEYQTKGPIDKNMLPDLGSDAKGNRIEWKDAIQVSFQCLNGEDKGTRVKYSVNNGGGVERWHELVGHLGHQFEVDPNKLIAVVSLEHDGYFHSDPSFGVRKDGKPGWIVKPIFKVVDWMYSGPGQEPEPEGEDDQQEPVVETVATRPTGRRASTIVQNGNGAAPETPQPARRQSTIQPDNATTSAVNATDGPVATADPVVRRRRRVAS
jgi:hypothetical protein